MGARDNSDLSGQAASDHGDANVEYKHSGELRFNPNVVRSMPSANVFKSASVILMTFRIPRRPYLSFAAFSASVASSSGVLRAIDADCAVWLDGDINGGTAGGGPCGIGDCPGGTCGALD
eukprot:CAMPEP_0169156186 /NCGR_PEP_ID=MMETSP1015-20121227/53837_1 /TAXON_ID=342587 /ORGANISM="Karlodinium micrum, Strain CCMP2283" /LENGTH=119 /DNA_ID=CAMNT_0009226879 /DNA_START=207 /DNA_END=562 /DNA_ORIENTATION=-